MRGLLTTWGMAAALLLVFPAGRAGAQVHGEAASQAKITTETPAAPTDYSTRSAAGTLIDQVVAVVNGDLVLESDIDEDKRFQAFQPLADRSKPFDRDEEVERLINRTLIVEQANLQPDVGVADADVAEQIAELKKDIPACKQYACETDAGWTRFVHDQGFTVAEVTALERRQIEVLRFVELRFRTGIRIPDADVKSYYDKSLLPEYKRLHAQAPKLDVLADRIKGILLEQQVSGLLNDWLVSLKAQGTVRIIRPGEVQP